jgi:hypothetical protein
MVVDKRRYKLAVFSDHLVEPVNCLFRGADSGLEGLGRACKVACSSRMFRSGYALLACQIPRSHLSDATRNMEHIGDLSAQITPPAMPKSRGQVAVLLSCCFRSVSLVSRLRSGTNKGSYNATLTL